MNIVTERNPYKDGIEASKRFDFIVDELKKTFDSVIRIGRKQLLLVDNTFYILVASAPSNLKIDKAVNELMRKYGKLPYYVLFTREVSTYPELSFKSYWSKIKSIYKTKGKFKGCVLGVSELNNSEIIDSLSETSFIPLSIERYTDNGGAVSLENVLKELGIIGKKLNSVIKIIEKMK